MKYNIPYRFWVRQFSEAQYAVPCIFLHRIASIYWLQSTKIEGNNRFCTWKQTLPLVKHLVSKVI